MINKGLLDYTQRLLGRIKQDQHMINKGLLDYTQPLLGRIRMLIVECLSFKCDVKMQEFNTHFHAFTTKESGLKK